MNKELKLYVVKFLDSNFEWDFTVVVAQDHEHAKEIAIAEFEDLFEYERWEIDDDILSSYEAYEYSQVEGDGGKTYMIKVIEKFNTRLTLE